MDEPKIRYWIDEVEQEPVTFKEMTEIVKVLPQSNRRFNMVDYFKWLELTEDQTLP